MSVAVGNIEENALVTVNFHFVVDRPGGNIPRRQILPLMILVHKGRAVPTAAYLGLILAIPK